MADDMSKWTEKRTGFCWFGARCPNADNHAVGDDKGPPNLYNAMDIVLARLEHLSEVLMSLSVRLARNLETEVGRIRVTAARSSVPAITAASPPLPPSLLQQY